MFKGFPFCLWPKTYGVKLDTVDAQVDTRKYMGVWYEMARMPMKSQSKCVDTFATYTYNEEKDNVNVLNTCFEKDGNKKTIQGHAYSVAENNSKLKVVFFKWLPAGNYWLMDLDTDNYKWAVVGEPCKKYAWILNREKTMDQDLLQQKVEFLREKGFKVDDLVFRGHLG